MSGQERYKLTQSVSSKEDKRRRVSPEDIQALQKRADRWALVGGPGRSGLQRQAREAFELYLDFMRHAIGGDFPRWLSQHSGVNRETCRRRLKAGRALAAGSKVNRNQSGLLAEQRERETRPSPAQGRASPDPDDDHP